MILATLRITVPPERRAGVVEAFALLVGPVCAEPGCLSCGLYQEAGGDGEGLLYLEEWGTPEQLECHMRSARYGRLLALMEASDCPPLLRYYTVSDVKGLEYLGAVRLGPAAPAAGDRERPGGPPGPPKTPPAC
jgi:quinol monooxygenase YgiN